jgi:hypothetical protein
MLHAIVHPADIQDRDGGILVMATLFGMFPFLKARGEHHNANATKSPSGDFSIDYRVF